STHLSPERLTDVVQRTGCAIVSASADIAPADKRLYAVRDVTATVDSLDLITASILSKKLAAGLDGLVLDVKVGSGAFMKDVEAARGLADALVKTANAAGCKTTALITDMNQPLAPSLGNALEINEVMRVLTGQVKKGALIEVCASLGGVLLTNAGLATDVQAGADAIIQALADGRAAERFGAMIAAMGGPVQFVESWWRFLPEATVIREIPALQSGHITAIDGEALGFTVVNLGGGRRVETDKLNLAVGLSDVARLGTKVQRGQPLAVVHAARAVDADRAETALRAAITITDKAAPKSDLILDRIG
ncbi:MAG: thymidine phosphorylase, partial [Tateyamaria sp.]